MYHYKPCMHTNSLHIQDNQKPLKVVNTASPYCSFEDCATKLNYEYEWLIYQAEVNIVRVVHAVQLGLHPHIRTLRV